MDTNDFFLRDVGARVRELRRQRGMTRRELGSRSGLSERFLAEVESGAGNPSLRSLAEIARALSTTPAALLEPRGSMLVLLGLRGAGKSTVGRLLADRRGSPFVELDARVEHAAGLRLGEIWELHGEAYYRRLEREALSTLVATEPYAVVAAGGGLPTDPSVFELLLRGTTTVWLKARPEVHWERVVAQGDHRPMANDPLALEHLRRLIEEREVLYRRAQHVVDTSDMEASAVADAVEALLAGTRQNQPI